MEQTALTFIVTKVKKIGPDDTQMKSRFFKSCNALVKESVLISWMLLQFFLCNVLKNFKTANEEIIIIIIIIIIETKIKLLNKQ